VRKMMIELEEQDVEEILELMREISERLKLNQDMLGVLLAKAYQEEGRHAQRDPH